MAANKIDWPTASTPSYTPSISTDYNNVNNNLEEPVKTISEINLTNWDTDSDAPEVEAGSAIEAFGNLYTFDEDESISTSAASSGTIYLVFDYDDQVLLWEDTAPTWSSAYRGWYVSDYRFTGHQCTWDGSDSFTEKVRWISNQRDGGEAKYGPDVFSVNGTLDVGSMTADWEGTYGTSDAIAPSGSWVPPAGMYTCIYRPYYIKFELWNGSAWTGVSAQAGTIDEAMFFVSDGENYRFTHTGNDASTYYVRYRKV